MPLDPARFTLDALKGVFEGYTDGRIWNGWACPVFTKSEADGVLAAFERASGSGAAWYNAGADAYVFEEDGNDPVEFGRTSDGPDGEALYEVGTAYWTWERVPDEQGGGENGRTT